MIKRDENWVTRSRFLRVLNLFNVIQRQAITLKAFSLVFIESFDSTNHHLLLSIPSIPYLRVRFDWVPKFYHQFIESDNKGLSDLSQTLSKM